jgi:hypothetical protein
MKRYSATIVALADKMHRAHLSTCIRDLGHEPTESDLGWMTLSDPLQEAWCEAAVAALQFVVDRSIIKATAVPEAPRSPPATIHDLLAHIDD